MTRHTHEWTDEELDYLARWYALRGSAFIRARYPHLSADAIRQMATRENLAEDMTEFTTAADVAQEAGVTTDTVLGWVQDAGYRRHCRTWGRTVLLPAPLVRLYLLPAGVPRAAHRPPRWPGLARAAEYLNLSVAATHRHICAGKLDAVRVGRYLYVNPTSLDDLLIERSRDVRDAVQVHALASALRTNRHRLTQALPVFLAPHPRTNRPVNYVTADKARAFLTARGHHAELIDTMIRKAQAIDAAHVKSDTPT